MVKSRVQSEGMIRLMSAVKKPGLRFRSFDAGESTRAPDSRVNQAGI